MAVRWPWLRDVARKHVAGILAGIATVALVLAGALDGLEYWSLSQLFERGGVGPPASPIVIVTIDESTFAELDVQFPFPRAMHAELVSRIAAGKPLVIAFDVIFDTPSTASDDEALGDAIAAAGNVVLGAGIARDEQPVPGQSFGYERVTLNAPVRA